MVGIFFPSFPLFHSFYIGSISLPNAFFEFKFLFFFFYYFRAVKQTTESINDLEGRHWSFDGNINTTNILGQKESSGPKNPELYKTQWCRNILVKGNCRFY